MRRASGAAQGVALLLAILSSESEPTNLSGMSHTCHTCGGPVTVCPICRHAHCDDETCPDYPIQCAEEAASA